MTKDKMNHLFLLLRNHNLSTRKLAFKLAKGYDLTEPQLIELLWDNLRSTNEMCDDLYFPKLIRIQYYHTNVQPWSLYIHVGYSAYAREIADIKEYMKESVFEQAARILLFDADKDIG